MRTQWTIPWSLSWPPKGDSQWRLTFPLPSDDLYYDGTLGLSFLDDQGVEENSFLIPVFLTT